MDSTRLDHLSRALAAAPTRRGTLHALSALLLGGVLGRVTLEEADSKKKGRKKGNDKKCPPCRKKKNGQCNKAKKPDGTPCGTGKICLSGKCREAPGPTCSDSVQNGGETGVDCGGGCRRCEIGQGCNSRNDCASGLCVGGACGQCAVAADCGLDSDGVTTCFCRTNSANQKVCTKQNGRFDLNFTCANCVEGEQCVLPGAGAECLLPCGA